MYYKPESKRLDDKVRAECKDGAFIRLSAGMTHYKKEGSGEKYAVLVHGYATPYFIYDKVSQGLTEAGYTVYRYDLFGRGLSDRPKTKYTADFFAKQLDEFVSALLPEKEFVLIGTSMGGIVTTTYLSKYGNRIKKLVLLAPAGMPYDLPLPMRLCKIKGLGELLFYVAKGRQERACADEIIKSGEEVREAYRKKFSYYAQFKGLRYATLSSLRHTLTNFKKSTQGYLGVAEKRIPTLVIWGTDDKTMPYYQSETMKKYLPEMRLITYQGSGHVFLYDEGDRTVKDILPFIDDAPRQTE